MEPPTAEAVLQSVFTLYNNPNKQEKEAASKWLEEFQKSVSMRVLTLGGRKFTSVILFNSADSFLGNSGSTLTKEA